MAALGHWAAQQQTVNSQLSLPDPLYGLTTQGQHRELPALLAHMWDLLGVLEVLGVQATGLQVANQPSAAHHAEAALA